MLKIILLTMSLLLLLDASDYSRANSAAKDAFKDLDCDFGDCPKPAPEPKVIIQEKVIIKEVPVEKEVVVEKEVIVEKVIYKDREVEDAIEVFAGDGKNYSCQDIKEKLPHSKSGYYDIFIENQKYNVYCEMRLAGGGWTRVWQADRENYHQTQYDYDLPYSFVENSIYTMISFDNRGRQLLAHNFKTPQEWKVQHPMMYSRGTARVDVFDSYTNKMHRNRKLIYGFENFSSKCNDGFKGGDWGKVCIAYTKAPFYASFNHRQKDYCNTSQEHYNTRRCQEKRFSIFMK
jgi:hypothetical protein